MDFTRPEPLPAWSRDRCVPPVTGFTLTEMMITLLVAAVLLSLSIPGFIDLHQRNKLIARTNELFADLVRTRSEAVKQGLPAVICRSADGSSCTPSERPATDWTMGWIVFVNADGDKVRDADELLLAAAPASPSISVVYNRWWRVTFKPTGRTGTGSFTLCDRNGNGRRIVLYLSGRARLERHDAGGPGGVCPSS